MRQSYRIIMLPEEPAPLSSGHCSTATVVADSESEAISKWTAQKEKYSGVNALVGRTVLVSSTIYTNVYKVKQAGVTVEKV